MGNGYIRGNELVNEPFDFSNKNAMSLSDLHQMLKSILFPKQCQKKKGSILQQRIIFFYAGICQCFPVNLFTQSMTVIPIGIIM